MSAAPNNLPSAVGHAASEELDSALRKIKHCLIQLSDDQLWWRQSDSMNSIANLLLHLSGNVRQWIVSGVGGAPDVRERQSEFDERRPIPKAELVQQLEDVVAEAQTVLSKVTAEEQLRVRCIQGFDCTGLQAIFDSVAHFRGHTQEIVHMTRCQLGDSYKFDFIPATAEQGASEE